MGKFGEISSDHETLEEASFWLARLDRGIEKSEEEELALWMLQSKDNQIALKKMCVMWGDMSFFEQASGLLQGIDQLAGKQADEICEENIENVDGKMTNFNVRFKLAYAATFLMAFGALLFYSATHTLSDFNAQMVAWGLSEPKSDFERYETERGKLSVVTLADGTEVTLNTDSVIDVGYSAKERSVYLLSGEAFFDVAHDSVKPFVVYVGEHRVQAVGTAFNIDFSEVDSIDVIVTDGKVKVATPKTLLRALLSGKAQKESLAGVGDQIVVGGDEKHDSRSRSEEEINVDLAWQDGLIIFENELLPEVLKELERYSSETFKLMHPDLEKVRVAGLFKANDIDGVLYSLDVNFGIESKRLGSNIVLSRRSN